MGAGGELPLPALDDASANLQASRVAQDDVYTLAGERSEFTMAPTSPLGSPAVSTSGSFVSCLLCVLFVLLLLMNAIVVYMYFYQPAKPRPRVQTTPSLNVSEDDPAMEPFIARPLVCSYHCVVEDPSAVVLPPDGLCHFLFFNLPDTRAYTTWDKGPCGEEVTGAAKAAAQTKFGLAVHASRANDTDVDLRLESGVFAFARQWDANVRQHGVNYLRGTTDKLFRNFKHHLAVLKGVPAGPAGDQHPLLDMGTPLPGRRSHNAARQGESIATDNWQRGQSAARRRRSGEDRGAALFLGGRGRFPHAGHVGRVAPVRQQLPRGSPLPHHQPVSRRRRRAGGGAALRREAVAEAGHGQEPDACLGLQGDYTRQGETRV
ncbi:uncharacterized protein LOC144130047 isoform X2 [Amblyomma americanum]